MNQQKYNADRIFGTTNEVIQQPLIETITGSLKQSTRRYDCYDYCNNKCFVELKSRHNTHDKYPTTMITANKLDFIKKYPDKTYYWFFSFTDGLYYHQYDPEYKYEIAMGGRCDRNVPEYRKHAFIPIELLTKVSIPVSSSYEECRNESLEAVAPVPLLSQA